MVCDGVNHRSVYIYPDAIPPIHAVSYHIATDKVPAQNGDKFRSIFSDNLQPIATRGKKARGTLLVDKHCGNGCSIKRAPLSVSYYNEISGGHIGSSIVRTRCSAGPVVPLWSHRPPCTPTPTRRLSGVLIVHAVLTLAVKVWLCSMTRI